MTHNQLVPVILPLQGSFYFGTGNIDRVFKKFQYNKHFYTLLFECFSVTVSIQWALKENWAKLCTLGKKAKLLFNMY